MSTKLTHAASPRLLKIGLLALLALAFVVVAMLASTALDDDEGAHTRVGPLPAPTPGEAPAPRASREKVVVLVLFSPEKTAWLEESVARFEARHPGLEIELKPEGGLVAVDELVDGRERPVVWSPADSVAIDLFATRWVARHGTAPPFDGAPLALVRTPLVLLTWEERAELLTDGGSRVPTWSQLHELAASEAGWSALGGDAAWGRLRLSFADPTRSSAGLLALLTLAWSFRGSPAALDLAALEEPAFGAQLQALGAATPRFAASTSSLLREMLLYGPSAYDVVVAYENLALELVPETERRWGRLRRVYPSPTLWSDHPAVVLRGEHVSAAEREAAHALVAWLRGSEAQRRALASGYRPLAPELGVPAGVPATLPPSVAPPGGEVIDALLDLWQRQLAR